MPSSLDTKIKRQHLVVKHNDIIQRTRFRLSVLEQKTIAYVVSLVRPESEQREYDFSILEYCKVCGINSRSGQNYDLVKRTLKGLRDKSTWIQLPSGTETTIAWFQKVWISKAKGTVRVQLDEDLAPYILNVAKNTTRYELLAILGMTSKYSIRLYEIFRSYVNLQTQKTFPLPELREKLGLIEGELTRYPDFRRRVLETAVQEISEKSDLLVSYTPIRRGRKTESIRFDFTKKLENEYILTQHKVTALLDKDISDGESESYEDLDETKMAALQKLVIKDRLGVSLAGWRKKLSRAEVRYVTQLERRLLDAASSGDNFGVIFASGVMRGLISDEELQSIQEDFFIINK